MRRNRKIPKKMSVVATTTMRFGAILVFFFVMVLFNLLSSSSCTQLMKMKGNLERELGRQEDERMREATRWEEMKTPERVENALLRHGLSMKIPRADQNVQMKGDGTPYAGQLSLAKARQRLGIERTASITPNERVQSPAAQSRYRRTRSR